MATKKQKKQMANLIGLGLAGAAIFAYMRKRDRETLEGFGAVSAVGSGLRAALGIPIAPWPNTRYRRTLTDRDTAHMVDGILELYNTGVITQASPVEWGYLTPQEQDALLSYNSILQNTPGPHLWDFGLVERPANWEQLLEYAIHGPQRTTSPNGYQGYGDATSAAQWYPSKQWPATTRYDHRGPGIMPFTPLGPVLTLPGLTQRAHPGLSETQYMQLYLRQNYGVDPSVYPNVIAANIGSDPLAVSETGFFSGYGALR